MPTAPHLRLLPPPEELPEPDIERSPHAVPVIAGLGLWGWVGLVVFVQGVGWAIAGATVVGAAASVMAVGARRRGW